MTHPYTPSPHSGAGNCLCGMAEESQAHPHAYAQAYRDNLCVCAHPAGHEIHTDAATASPNPEYSEPQPTDLRGTYAAREAIRQARGNDAAPQIPITFSRPTGGAR